MMRDGLHPLRLQRLYGIVQKEINQDGINPRKMRLVDTLLLRVLLRRALLRVFESFGRGKRLSA